MGKSEGVIDALLGLIRIAKHPENKGCMREAAYSKILTMPENQGTVLLEIIESEALFEVGLCCSQLSTPHQGRPKAR